MAANTNPAENPLYSRAEDVHPLHWTKLAARDPDEAARAAGAEREGREFLLPLLGKTLRIVPEQKLVRFAEDGQGEVGYQRALVALAYLGGALETPLRGTWVSFRELPGGETFFRGPHAVATRRLEECFGGAPPLLVAAARLLGGAPVAGADAAGEIPALPRIPLRILLWGRTSEFPPSAQLLTDARAHLHLALDVLWALTNVAISDLIEAMS